MADEPENLVLEILRRVETRGSRIEEKLDRLGQDAPDRGIRLAHVEENLVGVRRRLDRLDQRVDRIEKRLELVDFPCGGVRE